MMAISNALSWIALSVGLTAGSTVSAQAPGPLPALKPAVAQLKTELQLTDQQVSDAGRLVTGQMARVTSAVENFGGISFESVLDILVEARAAREEFIPAMQKILTEEQKGKLSKLPKAHEVYVAAMAGWLAEAQLGRLKGKVELTDAQIPGVRSVLLTQYEEAVRIVEGLVRNTDDKSMKATVLDAVVDLRTMQRTAERGIERELTGEQKARFESYRDESDKKSQDKSGK
jgi:hypothetical protein